MIPSTEKIKASRPELTVVLARPSESLTLLAQMIGRGSRLAPGKDSFWVIEIADKIRSKAEKIFHAADYLGEAAVCETLHIRRPRSPVRHREPRGKPRFFRARAARPAATLLYPGPDVRHRAGVQPARDTCR